MSPWTPVDYDVQMINQIFEKTVTWTSLNTWFQSLKGAIHHLQ